MQSQAVGVQPAKKVKRTAAPAAQPQHETMDRAAPESEHCVRQPGSDTTKVSRIPACSLALETNAY